MYGIGVWLSTRTMVKSLQDPGPELEPRIVIRIKTQSPFSVEYARISVTARSGAPTLVPHETGSPVSAEILVLDDDITVDEARNMLTGMRY